MEMADSFTAKDVVCGKGNGINSLPGNVRFRKLIASYKQAYHNTPRNKKMYVSQQVIDSVLAGGGRVLEQRPSDGKFVPVGPKKMHEKTCQALREKPTTSKKKKSAPATTTISRPSNKTKRSLRNNKENKSLPLRNLKKKKKKLQISCASPFSSSCSSSSLCKRSQRQEDSIVSSDETFVTNCYNSGNDDDKVDDKFFNNDSSNDENEHYQYEAIPITKKEQEDNDQKVLEKTANILITLLHMNC